MAFDLDSALSAWTAGENPIVQGSTILPHITVFVVATAGDDEWFRFSIPTGTGPAAFYIDVDYGVSAIGISTDTVIELYDGSGVLLASNDTSAISNGGFGSSSDQDPYINYTELTGGTFYVRVLETVTSTPNFEGRREFPAQYLGRGAPRQRRGAGRRRHNRWRRRLWRPGPGTSCSEWVATIF